MRSYREGGLVASYEKLVVDCEMLQAMAALLQPVEFSVDELALRHKNRCRLRTFLARSY